MIGSKDQYYESGVFPPSEYGGMDSYSSYIKAPHRRRLNTPAVVLSVLIPWGVFLLTSAIMTFSVHYYHPIISGLLIFLAFAFATALVIKAFNAWKNESETGSVGNYNPTWYLFLACTCVLACLFGTILGATWFSSMSRYLDWKDLGKLNSVNPTASTGKEYMDSGMVIWSNNTDVVTSLAIGFKDTTIYCVAPLSVFTSQRQYVPLASYDFWVAGTDCCNGYPKDFGCNMDKVSLTEEHGGLRIMDSDKQMHYRLAVQQAEAEFGIHSEHPLFFEWVQNPDFELGGFYKSAVSGFVSSSAVYLVVQVFLVATALCWYTKRERELP